MESIRITNRPSSRKEVEGSGSGSGSGNKEVELVEPVQMNIYQSNTYRKELSWLHFDDETRVQERQQVKDQQSCIPVSVAIPSSN